MTPRSEKQFDVFGVDENSEPKGTSTTDPYYILANDETRRKVLAIPAESSNGYMGLRPYIEVLGDDPTQAATSFTNHAALPDLLPTPDIKESGPEEPTPAGTPRPLTPLPLTPRPSTPRASTPRPMTPRSSTPRPMTPRPSEGSADKDNYMIPSERKDNEYMAMTPMKQSTEYMSMTSMKQPTGGDHYLVVVNPNSASERRLSGRYTHPPERSELPSLCSPTAESSATLTPTPKPRARTMSAGKSLEVQSRSTRSQTAGDARLSVRGVYNVADEQRAAEAENESKADVDEIKLVQHRPAPPKSPNFGRPLPPTGSVRRQVDGGGVYEVPTDLARHSTDSQIYDEAKLESAGLYDDALSE